MGNSSWQALLSLAFGEIFWPEGSFRLWFLIPLSLGGKAAMTLLTHLVAKDWAWWGHPPLTPAPAARHGLETALGRKLTPLQLTTVFPCKENSWHYCGWDFPQRLADSSSCVRAGLNLETYTDNLCKKNWRQWFFNLHNQVSNADFLFFV